MLKALFYKEWIKTRKVINLITLLLGSIVIYSFLDITRIIRIDGAVDAWTSVILNDIILIPTLKYIPLVSGLLLGFSQYVPEMINKRLKLTLHLPWSENKIILSHLLYGFLVLLFLFLVSYLMLLGIVRYYFAWELMATTFWASIPWLAGGFAAYLLSAWVSLEPNWKQRAFNTLIAGTALSLFYLEGKQGSFSSIIYYLLIAILLFIAFSFFSATRFKEGEQ